MNDFLDDPWSTAPTANETKTDNESKPTSEVMPMSTNEVSVTLKGDGGYDQPWIVIKAPNVSALEIELQALKSSSVNDLVKELSEKYAQVVGRGNEKWEPRANTPASRGHAAAPVAATPAPSSPTPSGEQTCKHGAMKWLDYVSKQGKPVKGWYCQAPWGAEDKCKPVRQ